jgi:uncharacterized protein (TIGR00730 family)
MSGIPGDEDTAWSPYPDAREATRQAQAVAPTPQTTHNAFRLAFADEKFLTRDELRPVRLMLELMKPELLQQEAGIRSTVVVFGSARIAPGHRWYEEARRFARLATEAGTRAGVQDFAVVTGGGPGIMEAANRGAAEAGGKSIGLSIVLPHEQRPNGWITPELSFQFHYFGIRKMHFLLRARALAVFPGGFGTFDELFETLTLVQTQKIAAIPILMFDRAWWHRAVNLDALVEDRVISPADLSLLTFVETAEEAIAAIAAHYGMAVPVACLDPTRPDPVKP